MKNYKVIGNEQTALTQREFYKRLSPLANGIISDTDPLEVREYTSENGSHYYGISGVLDADNLTADEMFETLEAFAKETAAAEYAENHPFTIESFGNNVPSNADECLAFLNEEGRGMNADERAALWEDFCAERLDVKPIFNS